MIGEYFQLTSVFHIGRQEDATKFFLQVSMFIDYNKQEFVKHVLYNVQLQENIFLNEWEKVVTYVTAAFHS